MVEFTALATPPLPETRVKKLCTAVGRVVAPAA